MNATRGVDKASRDFRAADVNPDGECRGIP
jgi:hypothetical protein